MLKRNIRIALITLMIGFSAALVSCSKDYQKPSPPPPPPPTQTSEVSIMATAFSPSSIVVNAGTTVTWTSKDNMLHTVTSNTGIFDSGDLILNQTYSYTFLTAGTYSYYCKHHSMTGTVTVK